MKHSPKFKYAISQVSEKNSTLVHSTLNYNRPYDHQSFATGGYKSPILPLSTERRQGESSRVGDKNFSMQPITSLNINANGT